jgi:hypothetical protein
MSVLTIIINAPKSSAKAKIKTDERDSYKLARLFRTGYIPVTCLCWSAPLDSQLRGEELARQDHQGRESLVALGGGGSGLAGSAG